MKDLRGLLSQHPIFKRLSETMLDELSSGGRVQTFELGDTLLRQGDSSDSAILILDGSVEIVAQTVSGPVRLATVSQMTLLGEIGVLSDLPRTATVRAVEPGRLLKIEKELLNRLAESDTKILREVIAQLGSQIRDFNAAVGVYTQALSALEKDEYDDEMLEHLNNPSPELENFAATFKGMAEQITLRRQYREEMASAAAIQRTMLPRPLPEDPQGRVQLFASMRPARHVGGDFYDAFFLDTHQLFITIGDVSGKGVPASLFMAVCQTAIRMAVRDQPEDIGGALERANSLLEAENATSVFATFFGARIDLRDGSVSYCNCGHNPPILCRAEGGFEELASGEIALGILSPAGYKATDTVLRPGDRLLLYTDGITEAHSPLGELFGEHRLTEVLEANRSFDPGTLVERIFADVDAFAADEPQHDDLTCLALTFCRLGG